MLAALAFDLISTTDCLLVEWEEGGHSVVEGKVAELRGSDGCAAGARVLCHLKEGEYWATVVAAGASRLRACMYTKPVL